MNAQRYPLGPLSHLSSHINNPILHSGVFVCARVYLYGCLYEDQFELYTAEVPDLVLRLGLELGFHQGKGPRSDRSTTLCLCVYIDFFFFSYPLFPDVYHARAHTHTAVK